uniref:Orf100 n=1 Tax=Phytophthora polonica TaxID=374175 RepID=A0A0Y0BC72_9STRA|nr:orf100 [Phytophthora polonica]AMB20933.1 orf100 [Phytophthora polonica]
MIQKNKKFFQKNKKYIKQNIKKKKNYSYNYFSPYKKNNIYYILGEKKPINPKTTTYLQRNKKIKTGIFFKNPTFNSIIYPFHLNLKLINEYLKKK